MSNTRDEMSTFVTGVSDDFKEECREDMLHGNMDLGRLMVHAQEVEDIRRRKGDRERKKSRSSDQSDSSNNNIHLEFGICPSSRSGTNTQVMYSF